MTSLQDAVDTVMRSFGERINRAKQKPEEFRAKKGQRWQFTDKREKDYKYIVEISDYPEYPYVSGRVLQVWPGAREDGFYVGENLPRLTIDVYGGPFQENDHSVWEYLEGQERPK